MAHLKKTVRMVDTLDARRCQVKKLWVYIPVQAAFFTHEKCFCSILHWKLYMVHVRDVKCINLSRVTSGSYTRIE